MRIWRHQVLIGMLLLLLATGAAVVFMLDMRDQDVTIYSVTPDNQVQVIGLRHRTYLLRFSGASDLILFSTTYSTGVLTYGRKEDVYREDVRAAGSK